ncbi:hypothetical protein [Nostoc sp.]|uniref:hypothetical protein n=1 Tax=Nostoc sp. TaxID=1180 RepID=UPI002FF52F10
MKYLFKHLRVIDKTAGSPLKRHQIQRSLKICKLILGGLPIILMSIPRPLLANPVPTPQQPSPLLGTRMVINSGFEQPSVPNGAGGHGGEGYANTTSPIVWQTTDTSSSYNNSLEIWRGTNTSQGGPIAGPHSGNQHAEINGGENASIYQDICIFPNENIPWSLWHAARSAGQTNIMQVTITDPSLWTGKTPPTTQLYNSGNLTTTYAQGWQSKTGSWSSTITSIKTLRFALAAIQGSNGDVTLGNFVDDINLQLSPIIDFAPTDTTNNVNLATTTEGNGGNKYYLTVRINGVMQSAGTATISLSGLNATRNFTVGTPLQGSSTLTGLTASKSGNNITLNIPAGTYDPNQPSQYLHIPIDFGDTVFEPSDNLTFTISNPTGGGSSSLSIPPLSIAATSCIGSARTTVNTQLIDDDTLNVSGTVFSDADADVTINGSDAGTNAGSANLTIYAIDTTGKVVDKATVAADGTYSFTKVPGNSSVTLRLSNDSTVAIGVTAPTASSIPSGWYYTGENKNGTVDGTIATLGNIALTTTTTNLTNENFGIRQPYTIAADTAPTTCNPDYRTALNTGITAAGGQLATGANDLNWTAEWIAGPASGIGTPYAPPRPVGVMPAVVVGNLAPGAWANEPTNPANARWISYPFRLSVNSNGNHNNADLDGNNGEDGSGIAIVGTSDAVRLKFTSQVTLPSNANTISISLPVGVAIDNQFGSIKVNGVENLVPTPAPNSQAGDYGSLKTVNITQGWQAGVNTIEIIMDSGPPQAGFLLAVQATSTQVCGKSNVVLVKRITAINGVSTINPSDNTTHLDQVLDNPATPNDDATVKWPPGYLVGAFNAGKIKPGDVLEYTVYFLNAKGANANTVKICDRIIGSQTYKAGSLEIRLGNATTSISLSDAADPALDRGQFYPSSASAPAACNLITPGTGVADNGTWAVDVTGTGSSAQPDFTTMPSATAPGTPTASYGFIRFKTIVNP